VTEIESIQYCEESVEIFKRKMGIEFNKSQYFEEDTTKINSIQNCKGARDKRFIGNKSQTRRIDWKSTRNNEGRAPTITRMNPQPTTL